MNGSILGRAGPALLTVVAGAVVGAGLVLGERRLEEAGLFIVSPIILLASGWLMHRMSRVFDLRRLTIPGFWYLTYLAMLVVPSFFVFFDRLGSARYTYMIAVQSALLTVPLGMFVTNHLLHFRVEETQRYFDSPVRERRDDLHARVVTAGVLIAAVAAMILYVTEVETIPIFYLLTHPGDYLAVSLLREESFKLLDSRFRYLYSFLGSPIFPLLIMISLGHYLVTRRLWWLSLFLLAFGAGVLYASFTAAKAPVAAIMLVIFMFLYLYRGGRVGRVAALMAPLLVLLYPVAIVLTVTWGRVDVELVGVALMAIWRRLAYLPADVLYWYFQLFPPGYLYGRSILNFAWLMGWRYFDVGNYVGLHGLHGQGTVTANAAFLGSLYADFGFPGVLAGGVMAGILMQASQIYVVRQPKTIVSVAVYAYLMFGFWLLHSTSLPIVLVSNGVLLALLMSRVFGTAVQAFRRATKPEAVDRRAVTSRGR